MFARLRLLETQVLFVDFKRARENNKTKHLGGKHVMMFWWSNTCWCKRFSSITWAFWFEVPLDGWSKCGRHGWLWVSCCLQGLWHSRLHKVAVTTGFVVPRYHLSWRLLSLLTPLSGIVVLLVQAKLLHFFWIGIVLGVVARLRRPLLTRSRSMTLILRRRRG